MLDALLPLPGRRACGHAGQSLGNTRQRAHPSPKYEFQGSGTHARTIFVVAVTLSQQRHEHNNKNKTRQHCCGPDSAAQSYSNVPWPCSRGSLASRCSCAPLPPCRRVAMPSSARRFTARTTRLLGFHQRPPRPGVHSNWDAATFSAHPCVPAATTCWVRRAL